jgi:hypothetical protein
MKRRAEGGGAGSGTDTGGVETGGGAGTGAAGGGRGGDSLSDSNNKRTLESAGDSNVKLSKNEIPKSGWQLSTLGVFCSCLPSPNEDLKQYEGNHAHRLQAEMVELQKVEGKILTKPSTDDLLDALTSNDYDIVHVAGHNQYKEGGYRLIGFNAGESGKFDTDIEPEVLADYIVQTIALKPTRALKCVILNVCKSEEFALEMLKVAPPELGLQVICWPRMTDDFSCSQFAKGFYMQMLTMLAKGFNKHGWVTDCYLQGLRRIPARYSLDKTELRGVATSGDLLQREVPTLLPHQGGSNAPAPSSTATTTARVEQGKSESKALVENRRKEEDGEKEAKVEEEEEEEEKEVP